MYPEEEKDDCPECGLVPREWRERAKRAEAEVKRLTHERDEHRRVAQLIHEQCQDISRRWEVVGTRDAESRRLLERALPIIAGWNHYDAATWGALEQAIRAHLAGGAE